MWATSSEKIRFFRERLSLFSSDPTLLLCPAASNIQHSSFQSPHFPHTHCNSNRPSIQAVFFVYQWYNIIITWFFPCCFYVVVAAHATKRNPCPCSFFLEFCTDFFLVQQPPPEPPHPPTPSSSEILTEIISLRRIIINGCNLFSTFLSFFLLSNSGIVYQQTESICLQWFNPMAVSRFYLSWNYYSTDPILKCISRVRVSVVARTIRTAIYLYI